MELVERYLQAVRFLLPKRQRDDVDRELSEDLRSQVEEREAELGRPLNEDELSGLLKGFGHPALLALRYRQDRHLIGPEVFPLFAFAVKSVLGILAVVHILAPAVYLVATGEPSGRVVGLFLRFPGVALPVLAWLTIAFAILDTHVVRSAVERALASWSPRSLPEVAKRDEATRPPSAACLVLTAVLGVWWLAGLAYPPLLLGPAAQYVDFGPIFHRLYVPMAAVAAASVAIGAFRLSHPRSARLAAMAGALVDGLGLAVLYLLWRADVYVVARDAMTSMQGYQGLLEAINAGVRISLASALFIGGTVFVWKCLKHLRAR